jgi:hypothetical protein
VARILVVKKVLLRLLSMTGLDWPVIILVARKTYLKVNWIERFWFITKKVRGLRITYPVLSIQRGGKLSPPITYQEMEKLGRQVSLESERVAENIGEYELDEDTLDSLNSVRVDPDEFRRMVVWLAARIGRQDFERYLYGAAYILISDRDKLSDDAKDAVVMHMAQLLSVEAYRVRKSMFPFLDEEFDPSILWEEEKIAEETVKSGVETLTEKPTIVKERRISLSELKEGPNCLRNFIPDWQRYNWVILFDIPRSALPSGLIAELLRKWSDSGWTVINIEKSGKFVIRGSVLVCTRSNYPSRYEELIKPSSTDPYVKRLLDNVDPEIVKIIITTKEIYRLKEVKESLDRCGFIDVEVTTAEEEKSAWEKLYEKSGSVFIADRYAEAAVLLPWLITKCGKNGLDLDGIKKLLDERAKKGIIEESDAETLYQIISEGVSPTPEFQDYKPVAISLGILKEAKRKDGEE